LNRSGYWNGEKAAKQLEEIAAAIHIKYPNYDHQFLFDWSSCHDALPKEAWRVAAMKLSPGFSVTRKTKEVKPFHSTNIDLKCKYRNANVTFTDNVDAMSPTSDQDKFGVQRVKFVGDEEPFWYLTTSESFDGQPKGLKQLCWERGLWKEGMSAGIGVKGASMSARDVMLRQPDIKCQENNLERVLLAYENMQVVMLPKYHCELNGIERVWGRSKYYTRSHCRFSFPDLMVRVPLSLLSENIPIEMHRRFARKARDYVRSYAALAADVTIEAVHLSGCVTKRVQEKKKYRSHRGVAPQENEAGHVPGRKPWDKVKKRRLEQNLG
jgi:hypothetical protein